MRLDSPLTDEKRVGDLRVREPLPSLAPRFVGDFELDGPVGPRDAGVGSAGVLEHVREALLHGFGTERSRLEGSSLGSLDDGLDRQTPIAHLRHEGVQLREPRLRTQRQPVVVTPKDSEQAPHLIVGLDCDDARDDPAVRQRLREFERRADRIPRAGAPRTPRLLM